MSISLHLVLTACNNCHLKGKVPPACCWPALSLLSINSFLMKQRARVENTSTNTMKSNMFCTVHVAKKTPYCNSEEVSVHVNRWNNLWCGLRTVSRPNGTKFHETLWSRSESLKNLFTYLNSGVDCAATNYGRQKYAWSSYVISSAGICNHFL